MAEPTTDLGDQAASNWKNCRPGRICEPSNQDLTLFEVYDLGSIVQHTHSTNDFRPTSDTLTSQPRQNIRAQQHRTIVKTHGFQVFKGQSHWQIQSIKGLTRMHTVFDDLNCSAVHTPNQGANLVQRQPEDLISELTAPTNLLGERTKHGETTCRLMLGVFFQGLESAGPIDSYL
jgi:hypothetical protein